MNVTYLTGIISNIDHSWKGHDLGWVIWCLDATKDMEYWHIVQLGLFMTSQWAQVYLNNVYFTLAVNIV